MAPQAYRYARMDKARLSQVQDLEQDLDAWVVAVEPQLRPAQLSEQQLKQLQEKEKALGVVLVAYESA